MVSIKTSNSFTEYPPETCRTGAKPRPAWNRITESTANAAPFSALGLDGLVVVGVGTGRALTQDLTLSDFADKHHVAAQINFVLDLGGEHGADVFRQVIQAIVAPLGAGEAFKLRCIPSGLHTEVPDGLKGHALCQHADIELAGRLNDFPGQVPHLAGNCQPRGIGSHLDAGVHDAAVILFILRGEHKQTVGQIAQRRGIFSR